MKINCSRKQRGVIVPLLVIALPVLLLAMGWALDLGHVFVNKTRLQNALDATALSAAITINQDVNKSMPNATDKGIATFNLFKAAPGNNELAGLNAGDLVFEYSKTLKPWGSFNSNTDTFAFVKVTSTNMLNVTPVLIRILKQFSGDMPVPAVATAGPVGNNCTLVPLVICPTPLNPQRGCDATGCNGIPFNTEVCLKGGTQTSGACQNASLSTGNFGFLSFGGSNSANVLRQLLAGRGVNTCAATPSMEPGNKVGPEVSGLIDRFNADPVQTLYTNPPYTPPYYSQYVQATQAINPIPSGMIPFNREVAVPVVDNCTNPNIIAAACFFLTTLPTHQGNTNEIVGELTKACSAPGVFSPTNSVLFGTYKIVLFKSPGSGDS